MMKIKLSLFNLMAPSEEVLDARCGAGEQIDCDILYYIRGWKYGEHIGGLLLDDLLLGDLTLATEFDDPQSNYFLVNSKSLHIAALVAMVKYYYE